MAKQFASVGVAPKDFEAKASTAAFARRAASASVCLSYAGAALKDFARGSHVFGLTKGQFSMIDIAAAVLEKTGPADVAVWTWCIAEYEVEAFGAFFADQRVTSLRVVMDWAGAQRDMPIVDDLQAKFGLDCIRVTKTHAKIVTIATPSGWRVTIRGSMNLNANPRFEQFDVSDDGCIFAVVDDLMTELWTRGKPLPVRKLKHNDAVALLNAGEVADPPTRWGRRKVKNDGGDVRGKKPVAAPALNVIDGGFPGQVEILQPEWPLKLDAAKWGKLAAKIAADQWAVVETHMRAAGTIGPENAATIELYCRNYARWRLAEAHVAEHGPIVAAPRTGVPMQNPYLSVANSAAALVIKTAADLGLPPSMRARVTKANGAKKAPRAADAYLKPVAK